MSLTSRRLRVALLGCGQIADAHLQEIRKIDDGQPVAVCDVHQDLADQAAARFEVPRAYDELDCMLAETCPDVVHVTTPVHTHAPLTMKLLEAGVHVYVEKPFAVDADQAEDVIAAARRSGRKVCLGHDQLFDPTWLQLKERVAAGEIGRVTHVKSVLGYPISGQFGRHVTADRNHWVRQLPGGLFQNTISHPLYRITDFLVDEDPTLYAHWYQVANRDFPTELSVSLRGTSVTGTLLFATNVPATRITCVYGETGAFEVDPDGQVVRHIGQGRTPGAFAKLEVPWRQCWDAAGNLRRNVWRFLKSDLHYFAGMRTLFERFYRSIRDDTDPPIPYSEMSRVTRIMDRIFASCRESEIKTTACGNRRSASPDAKNPQRSNALPPSAIEEVSS